MVWLPPEGRDEEVVSSEEGFSEEPASEEVGAESEGADELSAESGVLQAARFAVKMRERARAKSFLVTWVSSVLSYLNPLYQYSY